MNREFLERLYWAITDRGASNADGLNLVELYQWGEEVDKAELHFSDKLRATGIPVAELNLLDAAHWSAAEAREKRGFINGFHLGMKMAEELKEGTAV